MAEVYGIDVSRWQGDIDWDKLKANKELSFVILRAASGCAFDTKFADYIANCKRVGIPFGLYFASTALTVDAAVKEADFAIPVGKEHKSAYPCFFDMELDSQRALGKAAVTAMIKAWLERVSAAGLRAGNYTNKAWLDSYINYAEIKQYDLWYAAYPSSGIKQLTDVPKDNQGKLSYPLAKLWQWTNSGRIDGISENVDMNVCYESYASAPPSPGPFLTAREAILFLAEKGVLADPDYWLGRLEDALKLETLLIDMANALR